MSQKVINVYIGSSGDDADATNAGGANKTGLSLRCQPLTSSYSVYLRFALDGVYRGCTINSAYLSVTAYVNAADTYDPRIYIEDVANSAAFADSEVLNNRTMWGTYAAFTTPAWTAGTQYQGPDLKALIQHITDKASWVPGNYITLKFSPAAGAKNDPPRDIYSWDYDNANATTYRALLTITHSHACYPDANDDLILNNTTGSCVLQESNKSKVNSIQISGGARLDFNGFRIEDLEGHIIIKGSGSGMVGKTPSGIWYITK